MLLSRALSRGSKALGSLSALKIHQRPNLSSQVYSFVHESPKKFVTNDASLLHCSSLNFNAFQRFGISSSASPDPLGKENVKVSAKPSVKTSSGEARVSDQAKESGSVIDADMLKDEILKFLEEIEEETNAENKGLKRVMNKLKALIEIVKDSGAPVTMDIARLEEEIEELIEARVKLAEELSHKVLSALHNIVHKLHEMENSKIFGMSFLKGLGRLWTHVKGGYGEIDESKDTAVSLHEELEIARKHFSDLKPKFEEIQKGLELKLDGLRKEVELVLPQFEETSDDDDDDDDLDLETPIYEQYLWLTGVALCISLLLMYGN